MLHKIQAILLFIVLLGLPGHASYLKGRKMEVRQPDGSRITIVVTGDEFFSKIKSPEGCALVKDTRSGWYDLARLNREKTGLESRGIHYSPGLSAKVKARSAGVEVPAWKVGEIRKLGRTRRDERIALPKPSRKSITTFAAPLAMSSTGEVNEGTTGDILGLTLLVDFPDDPATYSPDLVDSVLNGEGYTRPNVENTVYDYYLDVSGGKLRYKSVVMPYWYRAPQPKAYYEDLAAMHDLIRGILAQLDEEGMDFSRFTVDLDGQVRALNVLYSGGVTEGSAGLWPHTGVLENGDFHADGVYISRHMVCWMMHDYPYVGTIVHENGHMLMGWPDLYDQDDGGVGVGPYSIMGFDDWAAPQRPDAALRYWAGWDQVIDITTAPAGTRFTIGATENKIFRFQDPSRPNEYFLVDARPTRSRHWPHDHGGLAVWHVDTDMWGNNLEEMTLENHYKVSLEQSDGLFNLESGNGEGNQDFFFHSGTQTEFHDGTLPNSRWWNGDESHLHLTAITAEPSPQGFMTFETGAPPSLATHTIRTLTGTQGEIIPLPAPCNLPHGAEGAMPAGNGNFGSVPQVGDRVFLDADGSAYGVKLTSASAWWLGFSWQTPYQGAGSQSGACSVLRGEEGVAHGTFEPQGPLTVTTGRTQTFNFFPDADYIIQDVRVDGASIGAVPSYTLHNIDADHVIEVDYVPGELLYHLTVQGQNGPGTYVGTGDHPHATWVGISATPGPGYRFNHWITTFGHVTIENELANPTRVLLNSNAVVLAVYDVIDVEDPCAGVPAYVDGSSYSTGDVVVNGGDKYSCTVGGWCSIGGPYAPGTGWAWENAWEMIESCE